MLCFTLNIVFKIFLICFICRVQFWYQDIKVLSTGSSTVPTSQASTRTPQDDPIIQLPRMMARKLTLSLAHMTMMHIILTKHHTIDDAKIMTNMKYIHTTIVNTYLNNRQHDKVTNTIPLTVHHSPDQPVVPLPNSEQ